MSTLPTYTNFESKGRVFDQINIDTKQDLDELILSFKRTNRTDRYIFRGCNNSKFKLFNSAQRKWSSFELDKWGLPFKDIILTQIGNARSWQNGLLEKFFAAFGQPAYDISVLSFLQHYGAPTPLLDWTYSFENSLFFATYKCGHSESDEEIENYCSVYMIEIKFLEEINLLNLFSEALNEIDSLVSQNIEFDEVTENSYKLTYGYINSFPVAYIPGYKSGGFAFKLKTRPSFNLIYNQQNLNIINQKGLFIFNNSKDKPLEHFFRGLDASPESGVPLPKIRCYNIHKSLIKYIEYRLSHDNRGYRRPLPIDYEYLFPQEELIATKAFDNFLNFNY